MCPLLFFSFLFFLFSVIFIFCCFCFRLFFCSIEVSPGNHLRPIHFRANPKKEREKKYRKEHLFLNNVFRRSGVVAFNQKKQKTVRVCICSVDYLCVLFLLFTYEVYTCVAGAAAVLVV
jgi:hypothetical protein